MLNEIIRKITEQQKGYKPSDAVFTIGEQLKEICSANPKARELVNRDLDIKEMSISECEKKFEEYVQKQGGLSKTVFGGVVVITPTIAHEIICNFYGIPLEDKQLQISQAPSPTAEKRHVDLASFL